jgi:hypothetical protein
MPAPDAVSIVPTDSTDFSVIEETPHQIVYKFWIRRAREPWQLIGPEQTDDERSDHWIFIPPMPPGSEFAYWLGVYGRRLTPWRARLTIAQRSAGEPPGSWTVRDSWTEEGVTSEGRHGGGSDSTDVVRVILT